MTWAAANAWIGTLNTSHCAGHNDGRLSTFKPSDTTCSQDKRDKNGAFHALAVRPWLALVLLALGAGLLGTKRRPA